MEIEFEYELHPDLKELEWLLGTWEGDGIGDYPTIEKFRFAQQLTLRHVGKPYLIHESRTWLLDEEFKRGRVLAVETGFWRVPGGGREVELLLSHPTGIQEIYLGEVTFNQVQLATDAVVRTATAKEVTGGKRLYGLFPATEDGAERDLGWVHEMAAEGQELQVHLSAQLKRVPGVTGSEYRP
ncbi:FABP family protein [Actinocorallia longicatena]|uniref:Peroxynitrite isomerase n=1 Tax=Actinocorallia longicatena TaxID=111803 RepID=A0ABP6QK83_9ACTN